MNEQMEAVQRMQEYIEGHLEEELTLTQLSEVSLYWSRILSYRNIS
jgi:YesN/AraC family two-component response regulator